MKRATTSSHPDEHMFNPCGKDMATGITEQWGNRYLIWEW